MKRVSLRGLSILILIVSDLTLIGQSDASGKPGTVEFTVIDVSTGYAVKSATLAWGEIGDSIPAPLPESASSNQTGKLTHSFKPGSYALEINAPGYRRMRTYFAVTSNSRLSLGINLDRVDPPKELDEEELSHKLHANESLLIGYVVDSSTRAPIAGADVRFAKNGGASVTTDAKGFFEIYVNEPDTSRADPSELPESETLIVAAKGYKTHSISGLILAPNSYAVANVALDQGVGETSEPINHGALQGQPEPREQIIPKSNPISPVLRDWLSSKIR